MKVERCLVLQKVIVWSRVDNDNHFALFFTKKAPNDNRFSQKKAPNNKRFSRKKDVIIAIIVISQKTKF